MGHLSYACNGGLDLRLDDSDLVGTKSVDIGVTSTTESTPETVTLRPNPPGSGHFVGSLPTTSSPPLQSDGRLSVGDGDAIAAPYVDLDACGGCNVSLDR